MSQKHNRNWPGKLENVAAKCLYGNEHKTIPTAKSRWGIDFQTLSNPFQRKRWLILCNRKKNVFIDLGTSTEVRLNIKVKINPTKSANRFLIVRRSGTWATIYSKCIFSQVRLLLLSEFHRAKYGGSATFDPSSLRHSFVDKLNEPSLKRTIHVINLKKKNTRNRHYKKVAVTFY